MPRLKHFHGLQAQSAGEAFSIACSNSMFREMKLLLADGVDIDAIADYSGDTPIGTATHELLSRVVAFMIEAGADVNKPSTDDLTPLMIACSNGGIKGSQIALQLLAAGADGRYVRKADEMTALKFAAESCSAKVIQSLIDKGATVDGPRGTDQTALMLAARGGNIEAISVLIRNGANVLRKCKLPWANGWTAEQLAECEGRKKAVTFLRSLARKDRKRHVE